LTTSQVLAVEAKNWECVANDAASKGPVVIEKWHDTSVHRGECAIWRLAVKNSKYQWASNTCSFLFVRLDAQRNLKIFDDERDS
jgi:hypothetical protein